MYEQLVGHQPGATTNNNNHSSLTAISAPSPRHSFLQELNLPGTPRNLDDLEKHINNEGQSIQQVQDWIDKLAQEQHENNSNNKEMRMTMILMSTSFERCYYNSWF